VTYLWALSESAANELRPRIRLERHGPLEPGRGTAAGRTPVQLP